MSEPSAVLLWQLGMAWSSLAAVVDVSTGHRIVLSGFVLFGPVCVFFTGRWLRTALAGAWAVLLVVILGIPDGIWGSRLETFLIGLAVFVAVSSTLALILTYRTFVSLAVTAFLAGACSSHPTSSFRRPAAPAAQPVSCDQQVSTWKHGQGFRADTRMHTAVKAVQAAEKSANTKALRSAMARLMPDAVAAGIAGPVPHCADPASIYSMYVGRIYTAGQDAHQARGLGGLLKAAASLKELKATESHLNAEVTRRVR